MRRLSDESIWFDKTVIPRLILGGNVLFTIGWVISCCLQFLPFYSLLFLLVLLLGQYAIVRQSYLRLVDEVWLDADEILIRNAGEEERVPLWNILDVRKASVDRTERIVLLLIEPCRFGKRIVFISPPRRWRRFSRNPIQLELQQRLRELPGRTFVSFRR